MRRAAKRDANEAAIVSTLRAHGVRVHLVSDTALPDATWAWSKAFGEKFGWMEFKGEAGRMTPSQVEFHETWEREGVRIPVVTTAEEAIAFFAGHAFRTYRDFPWEGYTTEQKAKRLAVKK